MWEIFARLLFLPILLAPRQKKNAVHHSYQDIAIGNEAQEKINKAVQELVDNKVVDVVALEGAFTPMDFSWYRAYPYQDVVKAVADWLFKEDRISGPVYTAFTSKNAIPQFIGIDQKQHYDANVEAYRQSKAAPLVAVVQKET